MSPRLLGRRALAVPMTLFGSEDASRAAVAVLLAVLTFAATAVAALQSDASTQNARSQRAADALGLQRAAVDANIAVGGTRDMDVFRRWYQALEEASWARDATGDSATASYRKALATIDGDIADWLRTQSRLLQPPYFDAQTYQGDFAAFDADRQAAAIRASEQYRVENEVANAWDAKASSYVTILTLLAVALFFLGLAATIGGRARAVLAAAGMALAAVGLGWTGIVAGTPVARVPDAAVEDVVRASVELGRTAGDGRVVSDVSRPHYDAAIASAEQALQLAPGYPGGLLYAGSTRVYLANNLMLGGSGPSEETGSLLRAGIADYEAYVTAEPTDSSGWWNLGWARYLEGDAPGALEATNRAIDLSPKQFTLYLNRALAQLALGDRAAADASVEDAIGVAVSAHLDSNGTYFRQSDYDIGRLADIRSAEHDPLVAFQRRLREAQVAIRVLGTATPAADAPPTTRLGIAGLRVRPSGTFEALAPIEDGSERPITDVDGLRVDIGLPDTADGRHVSVRLWRDGMQHPEFDVDRTWKAGGGSTVDIVDPYGRAGFEMEAGRYQVEVFVDGTTAGSTTFTLTPAS